jgi:hypothetical protein
MAKKEIGIIPLIIVVLVVMSWLPDSDKGEEEKQVKTAIVKKVDVTDYQKAKFKDWTLNNGAVTNLVYPEGSDWQIWVNLTEQKHSYTTKEDVEIIARKIARGYKSQTGYKDLVIVTVWRNGSVYAKGRSPELWDR